MKMSSAFHLARLLVASLIFLGAMAQGRAQEFRLFSTRMPVPERDEIIGYVLLTGTNRLTFIPPANWTVTGRADENKVLFGSRDLAASIFFKLHSETTLSTNDINVETLRRKLLERYPDAKIVHEFAATVCRRPALAFDLEALVERRLPVSRRVEFVALELGAVEFDLTVTSKNPKDYHFAFNNFVGSFQVDEMPVKK